MNEATKVGVIAIALMIGLAFVMAMKHHGITIDGLISSGLHRVADSIKLRACRLDNARRAWRNTTEITAERS